MADFPTWLVALRRSHDRMTELVGGLTDDQVDPPVVRGRVVAGTGRVPPGQPGRDLRPVPHGRARPARTPRTATRSWPIWDRWNALPPREPGRRQRRGERAASSSRIEEHLEPDAAGRVRAEPVRQRPRPRRPGRDAARRARRAHLGHRRRARPRRDGRPGRRRAARSTRSRRPRPAGKPVPGGRAGGGGHLRPDRARTA